MVTDSSSQSEATTAFLRAARSGNLEKVVEYLDQQQLDINASNSNGLNALHLASKDGHLEIVAELLKRGAKVDAATKKGNTALHIASLAGQTEVVNVLINYGAAVNTQSQNGFTPLYMAAQENHDQVVKVLLNNGANQSLATEDGFTPLAVAMQQGHDKVVSVLLENDSKGRVRLPALHIAAKKDDCKAADLLLQNDHKPDVTSKSGFTPLHIAAHYGNEEIARLLIKRGADVNYLAKHNISPLHVAAKWGKNNMVKILLESGAAIDAKTRDGLTPLHCAARSGHEQCVTSLLEASAPISARTKNGLAPLHMASQGDHVDAARVLLYHRAPVDEVTIDYLTSLHVAAHCGHVRVAKLLLDRKADPNARALNGFTPLHIACKKNRIKVVELLLKHGASIESTTESGLTPLHVASFMGCMNIVIFLLQHEASPDVPTVRGETPLHLAARANQTDIIRILLRNGAKVDARAREQQTPLHIASRLGNVDIVMLLLQHGAAVDTTTKDMYTALHIAAKEGQEEVAAILVDNNASVKATTKNGFTPLHVAAKYGNTNVAKILLQKDSKLDAQGKNDVTPLLLACHYDHPNVAQLLLEKGASPLLASQNGQTALHIAARKNQMDIASTLLEHSAKANVESKAGFTPLHLSSQKGHYDMTNLLIEHGAEPNHKAKNGLTALHLCAQEDFIRVASILVKNGANVEAETETGYRPIHVAAHFGNLSMIKFLLKHGAEIDVKTKQNYTALHQAAQQGHAHIVSALVEANANHRAPTNDGLTALNIAQKLGYISVMEVLKGLSYDGVTPDNKNWEEKYKVIAPEILQESSLMSDSDDEGASDALISEQPYRYLTADLMKSLRDDSLPIDVTRDDPVHRQQLSQEEHQEFVQSSNYCAGEMFDSTDFSKFLVSFLVDARGGTMKGCRHSGIRLIVPPRRASMPIRVTCRLVRPNKMAIPPPLMEGESLATRVIEMGPVGASFLGPVLIDIPHFASVRGRDREIIILRSENGETWKEHDNSADNDDSLLNTPFDSNMSSLHSGRISRIVTSEFPQYFAIVTRIKQEVHVIGSEGGILVSSVAPQVQAVFPPGALTKKIKVGLQAHVIPPESTAKLLGNCVAVSPVITIEPRRRKFHKPISLTLPVPQAANKGMINNYGGETPTLRLLCSIAGGTSEAQWEDVTGSTPLNFMNDKVSFTTTVSARFWLMDCRNIQEVPKMATELYRESLYVPFITNFVIYSKRLEEIEATLRILCMTDSREGINTLERQEEFSEIVKSRDVETLDGKDLYIEFSGNLVPVTKSGVQLRFKFHAFKQNRLSFHVKVKDPQLDPVARMMFMREPKVVKGEPSQQPLCVLNIVLPDTMCQKDYKGIKDSNLINQKMNLMKSSYGYDYSEEKGDVPKSTSPTKSKFIVDSVGAEKTDSSFILQDITASPAPEKKTYPEKRRFWEDMAKSKRESFQRSESEVSHTSQLTYHDSDSECLSEVRERSEEDIAAEKLAEMNKSVDVSQFTVAEKAHYFEEQIQKETTAARNSIISQSSQESGKAGLRLSGISFSSEDDKDTLDQVGKSQKEKTIQELKKHIAETAESKVIVQQEEKTNETKEIKKDEKKVEKIEAKKSDVKETKKEIKKEDKKDKKKEEKKDESKEHDEKQKSKDEKKTEQKDSKSEIKADPPKKEKKESFLSKAFFGRKSVDKDEKKDEPKKSFFGRKKEDKASKSDAKNAAEKESKLKEDIKTAKTEHEKKENLIKAKEQKSSEKTESSVLKKETISKAGENLSTVKTDSEKESKAKETKMQENVEKKLQEAKEELRVSMSEIKKDESIENKHQETVTRITEELDKDKSTEKKLQDAETEKSNIDAPKTDLPEKIVHEIESHVSESTAKIEKLVEEKSLDSEIKTELTHLSKVESIEKQDKSSDIVEEKSKNKITESTPDKQKLKQETSSKPIPIQQKSKDENLSKSPPKKGTMSKSPPKKDLVSRSPPSKDKSQDLLSKSPPKKDKPKEVKLSKSPPKTEKFSPKSEKLKDATGLEGKSEKTPDKKKTETVSTKENVEEKVDINLDKLKTENQQTVITATSSVESKTITKETKVDTVLIGQSSMEKTSELEDIKIERTSEFKDMTLKKDELSFVPDISTTIGKVSAIDPKISIDESLDKGLKKEVIQTNILSSTSKNLEKLGDVDVQKLNLEDTIKKTENITSEDQTNVAAKDSLVHQSMKEDHSRISPPKDLNIGMKSQDKDISSDFISSHEIKRPTSMTIPLDSRPIMAVSKPKDRSITSMPSTMITRDFGAPSISRSKQASPPKNKKPQVQDKKLKNDKPKEMKAPATSKNEKVKEEPEKPSVKKQQSKEEIPIKTPLKSDKVPVKADASKPTLLKKEKSKEDLPEKSSTKTDKITSKDDVSKSLVSKKEKSKEEISVKTPAKTPVKETVVPGPKKQSEAKTILPIKSKSPPKGSPPKSSPPKSSPPRSSPPKSSPPKGSPPKSSPPKSSPPKADFSKSLSSTTVKRESSKDEISKSMIPKKEKSKDEISLKSPPNKTKIDNASAISIKRETSKGEIPKSMIPKREKSKDEFSLKSPPDKMKTDDAGTISVKREPSKGEIPKSMIPKREKSKDEFSLKSPPDKTKTDDAGTISVKREPSKGEIPKSMIPKREKSKDEFSLKSPPDKTKTDDAGTISIKREPSKGEIPKSMIPKREKSKDDFGAKSPPTKTVSNVASSNVKQESFNIGSTTSSQEHEKSEESSIFSLQRETSTGAIPKSMIPKGEKSKDEFVSKIDVADKSLVTATTTSTTASISVKDELQTKVEIKSDQILDPLLPSKDDLKIDDSKLSTIEQTSKILSSSPETIDQKYKDSPLALKRPDLKDPRSSEVSISSDDDKSLRDFEEIERLIEEKGKSEPSKLSKAPSGPSLLKHDALSSVRLSGVSLSSDDERSLKDFEETERLLNERIKQESSDLSDHSISSAKDKLKIESTSSPTLRRDDLATAKSSELCFSSDEERSLRDFEETERLIREKAKKMSFIPVREKSKEEIILKREKSKGEIPKSAVPKREKSKEEFSMKRETSRGEIPKSSIPKREKSKEEFSMKRETSKGDIPKSAIPKREKSKEEFSMKRETSKGEIPKSMIPKRESSKGEIPKSMIPKRESSKGEIPKSMIPRRENSKDEFSMKREPSKGEIPKSMIPRRENSKDEFSMKRETSKSEIPKSMIPKREKSGDEFNLKQETLSSDLSKVAMPLSDPLKRESSKGEIPKSMIPVREPSKEEIPKSLIPKREKSKDEIGFKRESSKSEIPKSMIPKREKSKDEIGIKREASKGEIPKSLLPRRESSKSEIPKSMIPKREKSKDEIGIKREASKGEIPKSSIPKRESSKSEIPKSSIPKREKSKDEIGVKRESSKSEIPKSTIPKREKSKDEIGVKRESSKSEIPKSTIPKREKSKDEIGVKREASKGEITKPKDTKSTVREKSKFDSPTTSSMAKREKSKEEIPKKLSAREKSKEEIPKKLPSREKSKDDLPSSKSLSKRRDSKEDSSKPLAKKSAEASPKTPSKSSISSRRDSKEDSPKSVPKRPISSRDSSRSSSLSISENTSSPKTSVKSVKKESDSSSSSTSVDTKKQADHSAKDSLLNTSDPKEALSLSSDTSALSNTELLSFDTGVTSVTKQISDIKLPSQMGEVRDVIVSSAQKILDTQLDNIHSIQSSALQKGTASIETFSTTILGKDKFGDTFDTSANQEALSDSSKTMLRSAVREPKFSESEILNSGSSILDDTTTDLSSTRDSISFSLSGDITKDESLSSQVQVPPPAAVVDGKFVSSLSGARVLEILEPDQDGQSRQDSMDISSIEADDWKKVNVMHGSPAVDSLDRLDREFNASPTFSEGTNVDYSLPQDINSKLDSGLERLVIRKKTDSFELESPPLVSPRLKVKELEIKPVEWILGEEKLEVKEHLEPFQAFDRELDEYQSMLAQQQLTGIDPLTADAKSTKPRFTIIPAGEPDFEIEKELVENKLDISCQELMDTLQREYEAKTPTDDRLEEMAARSFNFSMTEEDLEKEKFKVEGHKQHTVGGDLIKTAVNVIESERFVQLDSDSNQLAGGPMVQLQDEQYDSMMQSNTKESESQFKKDDAPMHPEVKPMRTETPREGKFDVKSKNLEEHKRAEKRERSAHQVSSTKTKKDESKVDDSGVVDMSSRYAITVLDQVVKKEIAEVKENLEAAKQDLIEELSAETGENVVGQIQDSPSEFQLVGLQPESIPNELPFLYKAPSSERVSESENFSTTSSSSPVAKPRRLSRGDGSSTESSSETKKTSDATAARSITTTASEVVSITVDKGKDSSGGDSSLSVTSPVAASRSSSDEAAPQAKDDHSFSLQPPQPAPRRQHKQQPTSESEADLSSSESYYQSLDYDRSSSRPLSADVDAAMAQSSSEYETAMLSFEHSSSKATSQDYLTAAQTLSSKDSMRSATSVSSGQFCSLDSASEISETLMADEPELDKDDIDENLENILEHDDAVVAKTAAAAAVAAAASAVGPVEAPVPTLMKRSSEMIFTELISQVSLGKGTVESTKTTAIPAESDSAKKDNPLETTSQIIDLILARVEDTANKKSLSSLSSSEPLDSLNILPSKGHDPYSFEPDSLEIRPQQQQQQQQSSTTKLSSSVEDEQQQLQQQNIMTTSTGDSGLTLQQQLSMTSSSMSGVSLETVIEKEIDKNSDSDSFELVDKPDLIDDFVVVEEVGREAEEFDSEGKGIRISSMQYTSNKNFDRDVENLVLEKKDTTIKSGGGSQARSSRGATEHLFDFDAEEESPPQMSNEEEQEYSQSYSDEDQYQEGSKKWVEMQFQQNEARLYEMEYERGGPLEDIKEEEIADFDASSRLGSLGKESIGSVGSMRGGSFGSTPDNFETLAAKRLFKDHDNLSLSSLQEFEHLETAVALESVKRRAAAGDQQQQQSSGSQGSSASNGSLPRRYHSSRSEHDDASVSSVRDFESLEAACRDAHQIELRAREEEDLLDNESPENRFKLEKLARIIKAEGAGTLEGGSAAGSFNPSTSGSDDYEKRIQEIDDIIRMAKENVQHIELRQGEAGGGDDGGTTTMTTTTQQWSTVTTITAGGTATVVHAAGAASSSTTTTTTGTTVQVLSPGALSQKASSRGSTELNLMETSTDSLEGTGAQNYQSIMCRSSDSLELQKTFNHPSLSSDSLNNVKSPSREEHEKRLSSSRVSSDSLEFPVQDSQDSSLGGKDKSSASES